MGLKSTKRLSEFLLMYLVAAFITEVKCGLITQMLELHSSDDQDDPHPSKTAKDSQKNYPYQHGDPDFPMDRGILLALLQQINSKDDSSEKNGSSDLSLTSIIQSEPDGKKQRESLERDTVKRIVEGMPTVINLCISVNDTTGKEVHECSEDSKDFLCIGSNNNVESCPHIATDRQAKRPLCYRKDKVAYLVDCSNPTLDAFCFIGSTLKHKLQQCNEDKRRVCYRRGQGLQACEADSTSSLLVRRRRKSGQPSKKWKKEKDPTNVTCKECEVDVIMEVFEDSSTPKVEVYVRKLKGTLPPMKDKDD